MPRLAFLIFILALLCACTPAPAGQGQLPTGLAMPTVDEATPTTPAAVAPTTRRAKATAATTNTPTPDATPTPEAFVYNTERAKTEDQFTLVTGDQKQTIIGEIENSWVLDENSTASFHLSPLHVIDDKSSYIRLNIMYGQNCIVRASIVQDVSVQGQTYKMFQYVWEIIVNKQHRVVVTNHSTGPINPEGEQGKWDLIASAKTGAHVNFRFETDVDPASPYYSPLDLWIINEPPNPQAKADLKNGIIDENIKDNIWSSGVSVVNP